MSIFHIILIVVGILCEGFAAFGVGSKVNLMALGLAFFMASALV